MAKHRIMCALERYNGTLHAMNDKEAVSFLERIVHNRDRQLGDRRKGHFRKVLTAAWKELFKLKKIVFNEERSQFQLNYRFDKRGRSKRQKYPAGQLAR